MATTSQKKSTSTSKKPASRTKKSAPPAKQPFRREIGGGVVLVLALCVLVSYTGSQAVFIAWFAEVLRGLFGYGYWMAGPALVLAGGILLFHRGRPVALRVTCALLSPLAMGGLCHVLLAKAKFHFGFAVVKDLWNSGKALESGGVLSGALAEGAVTALDKGISAILFAVALALLLTLALHRTLRALLARHRQRPRYEEPPVSEQKRELKKEPAIRPTDSPAARATFDIPLDGAPLAAEKQPSASRFTGFFRHKSDQQKTPDQVLAERGEIRASGAPAVSPTPAPAESVPAAPVMPTPPIVPPTPPAEPEKAELRKKEPSVTREVQAATAAVTAEIEEKLATGEETYQYPPITLLRENQVENYGETGAELRNNSRRLADTLSSFGVEAKPGDVVHGPSVTRYEFVLDQGVKLSKITNLADDIALALGASGVRIAPIPDKISVVGIEVPNKQVTPVLIREVLESRTFADHRSDVAFAVGKDIGGRSIIGDISRLPHVLVAGTTGSGKSVCTNSLIVSLLYKSTPDQVRFIMVDPKMVELAPYNGIPHLLIPVVTDPKKAAGALQWAVFEMMKRYKLFSENNVKDLAGFNAMARASETLEPMPAVVVVIDELADLMLVAAKEVEESICRVAQMGRAAGMHLVIATQRPSADVITGLMKANIPSRIAFAVASSLESRIILDTQGAEKLVGKGDMLYAPLGAGKPTRVQGCFIAPEEIERVVDFVKQSGEAHYSDEVMAKIEESMQEKEKGGKGGGNASADPVDDGDELLPAAVEVVLETGQASVSMLQRRLKLGYSRAARLVDQMEERGIVGPFEGSKPRQMLISRKRWQELQMMGGKLPDPTEIPPTAHLADEEDL